MRAGHFPSSFSGVDRELDFWAVRAAFDLERTSKAQKFSTRPTLKSSKCRAWTDTLPHSDAWGRACCDASSSH